MLLIKCDVINITEKEAKIDFCMQIYLNTTSYKPLFLLCIKI